MFGAPEGLVRMTKGAVGAWYHDETIKPGVDRQQLKKEQEQAFYQKFFFDLAANGKRTSPPAKKHPRTEYAVGGATASYGVRGVYFPFCFDMPWLYDQYVQLLRLDFKHRYIRLFFARPSDAALVPQPERDLLPVQVETAGLEIMHERSIVDGVLHPVLQNTTRFKKKILGEKGRSTDGETSEERLFEHAATDPATK